MTIILPVISLLKNENSLLGELSCKNPDSKQKHCICKHILLIYSSNNHTLFKLQKNQSKLIK